MADASVVPLRAAIIDTLRSARATGRGIPPELEGRVRAYARAQREVGQRVEQVLIEVKALVRAEAGADEPVVTPKVVGWTVAGYYGGMRNDDPR